MCRLSVPARRSVMCALPNSGVIIVLLTVTQPLFTHCVTINKLAHQDIVANTRVELRPINAQCYLNNVVRISVPIINEQASYYLHKPNGDAVKLDIQAPKLREMKHETDVQTIEAKFSDNLNPIINLSNNYDVFAVTKQSPWKDVFSEKVKQMEQNEFMIGPVTVEDHGNWVLSVLTKDYNDNWVELFQVITISITEYVMLTPEDPILNMGETFTLSFVYPIPKLQSCELVAPRSTFDRFYDRRRINTNNCEFTVPNLKKSDMGIWRIIGVGDIIYTGEIFLTVIKNSATSSEPFYDDNTIKYDD